ncbi:MAG: hypothetical protein HC838_06780 [Spirulinaceae cyanobacterium RM2_2_10]|nr:hypothetical protein [Spirulinaceae cyanobacterium SM2_1_0]NJO19823.1 hypothetical protein [Spirulinaceae cyanobacterium RM2_2_10]
MDDNQPNGASLPNQNRVRLQKLLVQLQERGESRRAFAQRLNINDMTVKALLEAECAAGEKSLRSIAKVLGWQYWELVRYLDTGTRPQTDAAVAGQPVELEMSDASGISTMLKLSDEQVNNPPTIKTFVQKLSPLSLSCCLMEVEERYEYLQSRLKISRVQLGIREAAQAKQSIKIDPELMRVF